MLGTFKGEQQNHCALIGMSRGYSGRKSGERGGGGQDRGLLWITIIY